MLAEEGPRPLDAFSLAVLRNSTIDGRPVRELEADRIGVARLPPDRSAHWPESTLAQVRREYCAELATDPGQVPRDRPRRRADLPASSVGVPLQQSAVSVTPAGAVRALRCLVRHRRRLAVPGRQQWPWPIRWSGPTWRPTSGSSTSTRPGARPVGRALRPGREPVGVRRPVPSGACQREAVRVARRPAVAVLAVVAVPALPPRAGVRRLCARALDSVRCDDVGDEVVTITDLSAPLDRLRIAGAAGAGGGSARAGAGVNVAVLDSGVSGQGDGVDVVGGTSSSRGGEIVDPHGTAVASLIAGRPRADGGLVGIAPAAGIVDVRVYDTLDPESLDGEVLTPVLAAGLRMGRGQRAAAGHPDRELSLSVAPDDELAAAVKAVRGVGVLVVAETGNRGAAGPMEAFPSAVPGEDVARAVFPAGYLDDVIGVNATAGGAEAGHRPPAQRGCELGHRRGRADGRRTGGARRERQPCTLQDINTGWAAAEVSGILALMTKYPDGNPAQLTARLFGTASAPWTTRPG